MNVRFRRIILVAGILMNYSNVSVAQQYVGVNGGYGLGRFVDFNRQEEYNSIYQMKDGMLISFYYETKADSTSNIRFDLSYRIQCAKMEILQNIGRNSSYKNLDFSIRFLDLGINYSFPLVERNWAKINFLFGPTLSYILNTEVKGHGWEYVYQTQIDTNGNPVQILARRDWELHESNSKDLARFNFGLNFEIAFMIPVNYRFDIVLHNRYNLLLSNISNKEDLWYTTLIMGKINLGFRYQLSK